MNRGSGGTLDAQKMGSKFSLFDCFWVISKGSNEPVHLHGLNKFTPSRTVRITRTQIQPSWITVHARLKNS